MTTSSDNAVQSSNQKSDCNLNLRDPSCLEVKIIDGVQMYYRYRKMLCRNVNEEERTVPHVPSPRHPTRPFERIILKMAYPDHDALSSTRRSIQDPPPQHLPVLVVPVVSSSLLLLPTSLSTMLVQEISSSLRPLLPSPAFGEDIRRCRP